MLCEGNTGYIACAEIYIGATQVIPEIGAVGTIVMNLLTSADADGKYNVLVMDKFYNTICLYDYLFNIHDTFDVGTILTNRKYFPVIGKEEKGAGRGKFRMP